MRFQQASKSSEGHDVAVEATQASLRAKSCMAVIWVQNGTEAFDKTMFVETVKEGLSKR